MKHKTDHHKMIIGAIFLLTMGIAFFIGNSINDYNLFSTIFLIVNTLLLLMIFNLLIEIHGGKQVLHVVGMPKHQEEKEEEPKKEVKTIENPKLKSKIIKKRR
jgi:low temperature requirement protein LtrA